MKTPPPPRAVGAQGKKYMADRNQAPVLEVRELSKSFGSLVAVDKVSFSVQPGEIVGIAGPNGAGKTTLFNLITKLPFAPDSGSVHFDGRDVSAMPAHALARAGLVRTFQKETAFSSLTVRQNLQVAARYGANLSRATAAREVERVAERLSLGARLAAPAATLTVYETKRLMIATAMILDPRIVLLDEPASGLTSEEVDDARKLIVGLGQDGIAVLLIEHILPLLFGVSTRVLVMDFGRKLMEGTPEQVANDPRVIEAYLGGRDDEGAD